MNITELVSLKQHKTLRVIYAKRVRQLEENRMTTSDAQAVADCEASKGELQSNYFKELSYHPVA